MIHHIPKAIMVMAATCVANSAFAATPLKLSSDVYVERLETLSDGSTKAILEKPTTVVPGDNLIFVVKYTNASAEPASNLMVTNPLPKPIQFNGTADGNEEVSIDGGKSWGSLNTLLVTEADGSARSAQMSDVTHIRWALNQTLAAGSSGKLIFRGIVR